jgi:hypothetical protein
MYLGLDDFVPSRLSNPSSAPSSSSATVTAAPAAASAITATVDDETVGDSRGGVTTAFDAFRAAHPMPAPTHDLEQAKRDLDEHGVAVVLDAMSPETHAAILQRIAEQGEAEWPSGHALRNTQPVENGRDQVRFPSFFVRFFVIFGAHLRCKTC